MDPPTLSHLRANPAEMASGVTDLGTLASTGRAISLLCSRCRRRHRSCSTSTSLRVPAGRAAT